VLGGRAIGRFETGCDGTEHDVGLFEDEAVLEANDADAVAGQAGFSVRIIRPTRGIVVHGPVKFDGEAFLHAIEVEDERARAVLAAEPAAVELPLP
jgi:hypothetical protein